MRDLDSVQVNSIFDIKPTKSITDKLQKKGSAKQKEELDSSDDQEDEEEEDDEYGTQNNTNGMTTLMPMMHTREPPKPLGQQFDLKADNPNETNRGFFVSKLAGFEYMEGPEFLQKAAKELKLQNTG